MSARGAERRDTGAGQRDLRADRNAVDRLVFFSDAVIAIAMTLLAIELPVPHGTTEAEVLRSLGEHANELIAFVISFVVIALHWWGHHSVFRYLESSSPMLMGWSILWLFTIVVTPFATRVLNDIGGFAVRFTLYATVQAVASIAFLFMLRTMDRGGLLRPTVPQRSWRRAYWRNAIMGSVFAASIPLAFLAGTSAFWSWMLIPVLPPLVGWLRRRSSPA